LIWLWFALIQLISALLTPIGWVVCLLPSPAVPWLWQNEDAVVLTQSYWERYIYEGWRNPVSNLRYVRGVSGVGRPLFYRTWTMLGKEFYVKAGWMTDGFPCLSAGAGRGY
jgi:hypothetical protein